MGKNPARIIAITADDRGDLLVVADAFRRCMAEFNIEAFDECSDLLDFLNRRGRYARAGSRPHLIVWSLRSLQSSDCARIAEIKANPEFRRIPLVVLISLALEADAEGLYNSGVNTVIARPELFDELRRIVGRVCDYWLAAAGN